MSTSHTLANRWQHLGMLAALDMGFSLLVLMQSRWKGQRDGWGLGLETRSGSSCLAQQLFYGVLYCLHSPLAQPIE